MITLTLFTRDECPLCDAARFVLERVRREIPFELQHVDIDAPHNRRWHDLYKNDVPVVHVDGQEAFRHRLNEREVKQQLQRLARPRTED